MEVKALKTKPGVAGNKLTPFLEEGITSLKDNSIVVVTSKIISICEGSMVKIGTRDKASLIQEQAEYYLPPDEKYQMSLTVKNNVLIPNAGIDESNGDGYYILWPKNPDQTVNKIRSYLKKRFKLQNIGVIIADSKTNPLRWGVTGVAIAHSGFKALNDYIGKPDIFGRIFKVEKANIADALAAAAVVVMGEGNEQTPIAVIEDVPFVQFQKRNPSKKELEELAISLEEDVFAGLLKSVKWQRLKTSQDIG